MCFFMLTNPMLVMLKKVKTLVTFGQNPDPSFGVFFSSRPFVFELFCLKVKAKVSVLKLKLKFIFTPRYLDFSTDWLHWNVKVGFSPQLFSNSATKNSKSFCLENIKVRPRDDYMDWLHWSQ